MSCFATILFSHIRTCGRFSCQFDPGKLMAQRSKSPATMKKIPPLDVTFHVVEKGIAHVAVALNPDRQENIEWKIVGKTVSPILKGLVTKWMSSYIKGVQPQVSLPLLFEHLPPYTKRVLTLLRDVPFGVTLTYKQLAEITGNPNGARAVGSACSNNPLLLIIPCHRVLAAKGLGGFSSGLDVKQALLSFEGLS